MSGSYALPPLNDRLTNHAFSYLDAVDLAHVATTNRRLHLLAPSVDSSAGRVQKLIQGYQGRDGGLDRVHDHDLPQNYSILVSSHNGWVFGCRSRRDTYTTLFAPEKSFASPISLDRRFISRSERHLFVCNGSNTEVYNLQGELRATIPGKNKVEGCFELSYESNTLRCVKVDYNMDLSVWEIKDKQEPRQLFEHPITAAKPYKIARCLRLGDLLVLITTHVRSEHSNIWHYDLRDLQRPPQRLVHPGHGAFRVIPEDFRSNSCQLFFVGTDCSSIVTYRAHNGALQPDWERGEILPLHLAISFACAGERYIVVETSHPTTTIQATRERRDDISLAVFDTRTGEKKGSFTCTFIYGGRPSFDFQIWHDDILVVQDPKGWHFWELPHGRRLHSIKPEHSSPLHTFTSKQELLLLLKKTENDHLRLLDLSAMQPPEAKPTPPPQTLFEAICSYAACAFSWLTATLSRLWKNLFY